MPKDNNVNPFAVLSEVKQSTGSKSYLVYEKATAQHEVVNYKDMSVLDTLKKASGTKTNKQFQQWLMVLARIMESGKTVAPNAKGIYQSVAEIAPQK